MLLSEPEAAGGREQLDAELLERLGRCRDVAELAPRDLQRLLALALTDYCRRQEEHGRSPIFAAEDVDACVTATDAVIIASAVLDALSVEIFELAMWKTWGGA